ncbi:MAG: hypothetical protein IIW85_04580 [Bacteroidaceae bacterium]|nr:hypothetical protein [Bacteroidaceae bacterium]
MKSAVLVDFSAVLVDFSAVLVEKSASTAEIPTKHTAFFTHSASIPPLKGNKIPKLHGFFAKHKVRQNLQLKRLQPCESEKISIFARSKLCSGGSCMLSWHLQQCPSTMQTLPINS